MNLLLIFRLIDTSKFVDRPLETDTETQDPYLSLLQKNPKKPEIKKIRKFGL